MSPARRDLLGLTAEQFIAWGRGCVGHADRFHRALYRDLITTGTFDPQRVAMWHEAEQASPGVTARFAEQAQRQQIPDVVQVMEAADPEHGLTRKIVTRTVDERRIESVLIPMGGGQHHTVCISSQVGCRMGCGFCHTATMGLIRNLAAHEMVGQLTAIAVHSGVRPRNVVFMGMGEPLDNPEAVAAAVRVFTDVQGFAIARRHVTISTVGRIDGLARWSELGLEGINLAVSLTAADDALRSELMPINRAMPLAELHHAVQRVPMPRHRRILFAVVVIPGVTDGEAEIRALIAWLRDLPALVNLIPFNPIPSRSWRAPTLTEMERVRAHLDAAGIATRMRSTKGDAVMAACGQLGDPRQRTAPSRVQQSA